MKYAMIPINRRYDENNNRIVRRVLISYKTKDEYGVYIGSKIIEKDPYFKDKNSSHQYLFENDGFRLIHDAYGDDYRLGEKRPYEYSAGELIETSFEFEATNKKEAIKIFTTRNF